MSVGLRLDETPLAGIGGGGGGLSNFGNGGGGGGAGAEAEGAVGDLEKVWPVLASLRASRGSMPFGFHVRPDG